MWQRRPFICSIILGVVVKARFFAGRGNGFYIANPFESLQTCKNKTPGWRRGSRQEGASPPWGLARAGAAPRRRRRPSGPGALRGVGGLGGVAWAGEGAGLRGSGLAPRRSRQARRWRF